MSYCLAIQTDHGLVFASDSRTHGGVHRVNTYSKMRRFEVDGERVFVLLSAGNLSTTRGVVHGIDRQFGGAERAEALAELASARWRSSGRRPAKPSEWPLSWRTCAGATTADPRRDDGCKLARVTREAPIKSFPSAAQGCAAKFDGVSH